jgi:hypothetical protein
MSARIEVSGSEMRIAPRSVERRAASLASATIAPEISALSSRYVRRI